MKISAKKVKKTLLKKKGLILASVLWSVLIVMGINLWSAYSIHVDAPDEVLDIESSLANKPLIFLAHVNLDRLLSRKKYFLKDLNSLPGTDTDLFQQLKKEGVDPNKSIKQMLSVAYFDNKKMVSQTILLGKFSVAAVKKFFVKNYNGKVIPGADFTHLKISQMDERICKMSQLMEVTIEPERILISSNGYLSDLRQLLKQPPGNVTDLSNWKEYRSDKLISLALFKPKSDLPKKSGLPMMMASDILKKNQPVDSLFASIGLQLLPPAGLIDVSLNSTDQSWLDKTQKDLLKQIEEMKQKSLGLINLQGLLEKISFKQDVHQDLRENSGDDIGQLSMGIELDSEFKKSFELSLQEFVEKFFSVTMGDTSSGLSHSQQDHSKQQPTEKLNKTPLKYWSQYSQSKLKPFNEAFDSFFKPVWIGGPFALSIDELLLESDPDGDQVILQLKGKGQNIDNIGSQQAQLKVTEVSDQQGNNLLEILKCGQAGASDTFFSSLGGMRTAYVGDKNVSYSELEVRQKIKLKKGIKFSHVQLLKGQIELNLATQTQTKEFAKTDQNKVLTDYGIRILFTPSGPDSLSYTVSGDAEKILAIRALNKDKKYLSHSSSTSMSNLLSSGLSATQAFYGKIAFIEVVYATKYEKMNYPFEIAKFPPYPSADQWKYELEFAKLSSIKNWNEKYQDVEALDFDDQNNWQGAMQASWHDGPLNLALYGLKTSKHWGTTGQLTIKTPLIEEFRHNLSALEIVIRYPEAEEKGNTGHSYFYPLKAKGYYMNGEFVPDREKPFMDGQLSFTLPYKNEEKSITEIKGDIIVHLPVSKHNTSFTDMSIGAVWEDEGLRTKIVRLGNEVMEIEVSGKRNQLLQINLVDSKDQRISTTDIRQGMQSQSQDGNILVNYRGIPVKALVTVSEGQQTRRYPFILKLK